MGKSSVNVWDFGSTRNENSQSPADPVKEHGNERCSSLERCSGESSLLLEERKQAKVEEDPASKREDDEFDSHEEGELQDRRKGRRSALESFGKRVRGKNEP